jgi:hypothetical protein
MDGFVSLWLSVFLCAGGQSVCAWGMRDRAAFGFGYFTSGVNLKNKEEKKRVWVKFLAFLVHASYESPTIFVRTFDAPETGIR